MRSELFYKHDLLPFAEIRYSRGSTAPFKPHLHRALSIGAVDQGQVNYTIGTRQAILAPGALAVINPDTLHACNPASDAARSYYMLYLDTAWCLLVQQAMWEVDRLVEMTEFRIDGEPIYRQYCRTMECCMAENIHLQEKEQMLFDLAAAVFSVACSPRTKKKAQRNSSEQLKKLLAADLQNDVPITVLARRLKANPYTLIRNFKADTGITPHAYRMNCRIEQAKELLRQGHDIADTALQCGFFDQSHLHRYFKAMTTITPRQYLVNFIQ